MRGIFIKVNIKSKDWYHKDLMDATYEERKAWFKTLKRSELVNVIEHCINKRKKEC